MFTLEGGGATAENNNLGWPRGEKYKEQCNRSIKQKGYAALY